MGASTRILFSLMLANHERLRLRVDALEKRLAQPITRAKAADHGEDRLLLPRRDCLAA